MYIKTQKCSFLCNDNTCSYVGKICLHFFFLWEGQGHFLGIRIKCHLGRAKGRGKRGYGREAQNNGYFCKIPIIQLGKSFFTQTVSSDFKQFFLSQKQLVNIYPQ